MKKLKFLSCILSIALVLNIMLPVASAADINNVERAQLGVVSEYGDYAIRGVETPEVRYNILVDSSNGSGQFAIVYLDSPDYMYEYSFDIHDALSDVSNIRWEELQTFCFDHDEQWTQVYLPSAITVIDDEDEPAIVTRSSDSDAVQYFEDWLIDKYGDEYSGKLLSTKTQNGTKMYLKSGFQAYAYRDRSYLVSATMTVVGFVTGILGLASGATAVAVIGAIAGTGGLLTMGQKVHEYKVRANWFRYSTLVSGTGYPYGLSDKFTYYTGYMYTGTGTCNVDEASADTSYIPSSTVYNSYANVFNAAYEEYGRIGWQEGNF